jgi:predicted ATPase/transcriptional regulator with XRE-family HTH domain
MLLLPALPQSEVIGLDTVYSFGLLVRRRRKALDLTQAALARAVGCAESLIRKIEADERRPSRQVAERLAGALQVAPEQLERFVQAARGERSPDELWPILRAGQDLVQPAARRPHTILPTPLSPLVGRAAELLALGGMLADPAIRLVTIVAPGGMGKTRLAIAAAARQQSAARFPDGVVFLDLTPIERPEQLAPRLAALFGLLPDTSARADRPAEQQILGYLGAKRLLLVLDNAEHMLEAAPLFTAMLESAPGLALLVTSREPLRLRGEQLFPLGGLDAPADRRLAEHSDATRLFVQAARRASPAWAPAPSDFVAIAGICALAGGMPLAIELAGAWTAAMAPAAILAAIQRDLDMLATSMRDAPERQRSVRAVFEATCRQMRPELEAAFVRLAVFRAGCIYPAAAAVAGATLRDLADLVAAAVLRYDPAAERYTLHELLRQYAAERLAGSAAGEAAALAAHAEFFCAYLAEHAPKLRSLDQRAAQLALEREQENIGAAWRWALGQRRIDLIDQVTGALGLFYEQRADTVRGVAVFDAAAAGLAEQPELPLELRARLLTWRSAFLRPLGQLAEAERLARRALELLDLAPDTSATWRAAAAHARLRMALAIDDLRGGAAMPEYQIALGHFEALDRVWEQSYVVYHIARLCCDLDQLDAAARYGAASLALRDACGDARGRAHTLQLLSRISLARGELGEGLALARRCHGLFEQLGDRAGVAKGLRQIGMALAWHGRFAEALPLAEQSLAIYQEYGLSHEVGVVQALLSQLHTALGDAERAAAAARSALALHAQHPGALADDHAALGLALLAQARDRAAEQALRSAVACHAQLGRPAVSQASALLGLCLALRREFAEARPVLAAALRYAGERQVLAPLPWGLAGAALLLAGSGDRERAAEAAALAGELPGLRHHRGLSARLQSSGSAERGLFGFDPGAEAAGGEAAPAIWDAARQVGELVGE